MIKVNKSQLRLFNKKLKKLGNKSEQELSNELGRIALESAREAKKTAPIDTGNLRQEIAGERIKPNEAKVSSKAVYSPYIEFGTGGNISLEDMRELGIPDSYAAQWKGKTKRGNMHPQPFFFSSIRKSFAKGLVRIDKTLKRLSK